MTLLIFWCWLHQQWREYYLEFRIINNIPKHIFSKHLALAFLILYAITRNFLAIKIVLTKSDLLWRPISIYFLFIFINFDQNNLLRIFCLWSTITMKSSIIIVEYFSCFFYNYAWNMLVRDQIFLFNLGWFFISTSKMAISAKSKISWKISALL